MLATLISRVLSAAVLFAMLCGSIHAQQPALIGAHPLLHPLFSDNAVLQRDRPVPIWGWTKPGAKIVVHLDMQTLTARADRLGRWTVTIAPHTAGGPHSLSVAGTAPGESVTRTNLLFGDVWLCGGQSNMAYDLYGANNPEAEIAAANYPTIRLLNQSNAIKAGPIDSFEGTSWQVCSPQTVAKFSGVGYFFGRTLSTKLKVPIGLINSSWSGTPGQSWVSGPALATMPAFKPAVDALKKSAAAPGSSQDQRLAWWQNDPGTVAHQEASAFDDAAWQTISVPGYWEGKGFAGFDGVMWFRRTVDVPAAWAGRDLKLNLGGIDDSDTTYWNGTLVGATDDHQKARHYTVPGAKVQAGRMVLAVRVLDTGGDGGFSGPALSMESGTDTLSLDGGWKVHQGPTLQSLPAQPPRLDDPNAPTVLFNGKIAPLLPEQLKGIIWYQGESNADTAAEAEQYRTLLPLLVNDWRAHFGAQVPFYIVQLAGFKAPDDVPSDDPWPNLREAQIQTSQRLPNTGLTVVIDLGEQGNVHFRNKQEAGRRLALSALKHTYGLDVEADGPTLRGAKAAGGTIQLTFDHAQGLSLKGDGDRVFAVAGADRKFYWATPQLSGSTVNLRSANVAAPLYARFGWSNFPRATLSNAAGLPASPFRTDK